MCMYIEMFFDYVVMDDWPTGVDIQVGHHDPRTGTQICVRNLPKVSGRETESLVCSHRIMEELRIRGFIWDPYPLAMLEQKCPGRYVFNFYAGFVYMVHAACS